MVKNKEVCLQVKRFPGRTYRKYGIDWGLFDGENSWMFVDGNLAGFVIKTMLRNGLKQVINMSYKFVLAHFEKFNGLTLTLRFSKM